MTLLKQIYQTIFSSLHSQVALCPLNLMICLLQKSVLTVPTYYQLMCKALVQLNTLKSKGIDQIGPLILKHCASALFRPLHHLICQSLIHRVLLQDWKDLITPVYKSGERSDIRSILLLCSISKVLEKLVSIMSLLLWTLIAATSQSVFVKGRSPRQQLLVMVHHIAQNLESKLAQY